MSEQLKGKNGNTLDEKDCEEIFPNFVLIVRDA